jgi:hypothetical protein
VGEVRIRLFVILEIEAMKQMLASGFMVGR